MSKKIQKRVRNAMNLFGFSVKPTREQLRAKYREMAKKHHPDRGGSESNFKKVNWANDILNKHAFDDELKQEAAASIPEESAGFGKPNAEGISQQPEQPAAIGGGSDTLAIGTEGVEPSIPQSDLPSMLGSGMKLDQPGGAHAQEGYSSEPPPMAQVLEEPYADEAFYDVLMQPDSKKKRQKDPDWWKFLGELGRGVSKIGGATGSDNLSSIGGGLQGISQMMGAVKGLGGGSDAAEDGNRDIHGDTITNLLGAVGSGSQGSQPSTQAADPSDDLQKAIDKLTEAVEKLIEKLGGQAQSGVGGTQMPTGGSLGTGIGDGIDMKQIMQIIELIATMGRMLAMAA